MTLLDDHYRKAPEYYDWMYLDGFTPDEILYAFHKKMDREQAEREALADSVVTVKIKSEVKIKGELTAPVRGRQKRKRRKSSSPFWRKRFSALWKNLWKPLWIKP